MTAVVEGPTGTSAKDSRVSAASIDADTHPVILPDKIAEHLSGPFRDRFLAYGHRVPLAPEIYPRVRNGGTRLDARGESGVAGSSLSLMQEQLLDLYGVENAILIPLQSQAFGIGDASTSAELSRALNDCITQNWLDAEPRLRSSITIPHEAPELAGKEIRRRAADPRFVQVLLPTVGTQPLGQARYWPIYAAAVEVGRPVAVHFGGLEAHNGAGWPSFYLEIHAWASNTMIALVMNLICEGVFEEYPDLQIVLVEGGMAWASSLMWAMDEAWLQLRDEVPHVKKLPSEYFREHFWFTTQPIEEPESSTHLVQTIEHSGMADRIMFSSDYPHWDFDSPAMALRHLSKDMANRILFSNAKRLYKIDVTGAEQ